MLEEQRYFSQNLNFRSLCLLVLLFVLFSWFWIYLHSGSIDLDLCWFLHGTGTRFFWF